MGPYKYAGISYLSLGIGLILQFAIITLSFIYVINSIISGNLFEALMNFLFIWIIMSLVTFVLTLIAGVFSILLYNETNEALLIVSAVFLFISSIFSLFKMYLWVISMFFVLSFLFIGNIIDLITFIVFGISMIELSNLIGDERVKTGGIIILIGGILLIILGIGYVILAVGLIYVGRNLMMYD